MVNVKGYQESNRIIVQYYDTGNKDRLECPFCHWEGSTQSAALLAESFPAEVCCPHCATQIAVVSSILFEASPQSVM